MIDLGTQIPYITTNMKTETVSELIFLVEEAPEGGFVARSLGESIFTEAYTLEDLPEKLRDAVRCHFDPVKGRIQS